MTYAQRVNNTNWELRQFEIFAHKWIDKSQPDYGVALLNDCKYGHYVKGNILDINLLRSPSWPDPTADRAEHEFTYALYPHPGNHIESPVTRVDYELNVPLKYLVTDSHHGKLKANWSFVKSSVKNVIVDVLKQGEDGKNIVVRMYETDGKNAKVTIKLGIDIQSVLLTKMMEKTIESIAVSNDENRLNYRPFEIHTIKIKKT